MFKIAEAIYTSHTQYLPKRATWWLGDFLSAAMHCHINCFKYSLTTKFVYGYVAKLVMRSLFRNIISEYSPEYHWEFFRIYWEYLMGMFHEYSAIIYLLGGKDSFFSLISFTMWFWNKNHNKINCQTKSRKPIQKISGYTSGVKHTSFGFTSWWLFSNLLLH